jgi:DNA repair protein SbcC/Rad50
MIPVKLTIQGLYSYRQKQTIDFNNLTAAGLFGLFGGVGSGKSTILEAIAFALYGESERLNKGDNRNYNMMNLKSNELLIDFEFKTGVDDRYRFTVSGKRNGKQFDEVKTLSRAAYKFQDGHWMPLEKTSAEQATGLSYDNFRRTIIIPQGKFQEFLQLGAKERTAMLMELFNLGKYDLAGKVIGLENRNNEKIHTLNGEMAPLLEHTPAKLDELALQRQTISALLETRTAEKKQLESTFQELEQIKTLQEKAKAHQTKLDGLALQEPAMKQLEFELQEYLQITQTFNTDLELKSSLSAKIATANKELSDNTKALGIDVDKQKKNDLVYAELKPLYDTKDQLLKQADELGKMAQMASLKKKLTDADERIAKGKIFVDDKTNLLNTLRTQRDAMKKEQDHLRQSMPDMAKLVTIKEWFVHHTNHQKSMAEAQKRLEGHDKDLSALQTEAHVTMSAICPDPTQQPSIDNALVWFDKEGAALNEQKESLQQSKTRHEVSRQLQSFAEALQPGDACPLCGSSHHPHVFNATDADGQLAKIDAEKNAIAKREKVLDDARGKMGQYLSKIQLLQQQREADKQALAQLQEQVAQHIQQFVWADFSPSNPQAAVEAFEKANATAKQLDNIGKQLDDFQKQLEKTEVEKEKYAKALEQIEREKLGWVTESSTLASQIVLLNVADFAMIDESTLKEKAVALANQHNALVEAFQKVEKEQQAIALTINQLKGKIAANETALSALKTDLQQLDGHIAQKLAQRGNITLEQVEAIRQKKLDTATITKNIEQWRNDFSTAKELLKSFQAELNGKTFDTDKHQEISAKLAEATRHTDQINQEIGNINSQIKTLQEKLKRKTELTAELDKLMLRAANLTELKNLFRSSGFVNYVSTVYLQNLCAAANDRFYRLTRQHLSLELATDNTFVVRDFMNEGKTRSVKTLSGGQTFQASLSLALALADSVRHLSAGHESFFFLDEGFGTLDRESLSSVFDTLKSLRHENRIVGVISHVDEMQQEIQTYLKITNNEESGSMVRGSWEE